MAELCRKLETEKEKVLPYSEDSVDIAEIPEQLKEEYDELSVEDQ